MLDPQYHSVDCADARVQPRGGFSQEPSKQFDTDSNRTRREAARILATGKRITYYKNYIELVAPWVSCTKHLHASLH